MRGIYWEGIYPTNTFPKYIPHTEGSKGFACSLGLATAQTGLWKRVIRTTAEMTLDHKPIWAIPNPRLHAKPLLPSVCGMYLRTLLTNELYRQIWTTCVKIKFTEI